uniref:DEAD/DEAH box helicase n=1 Tax=Bradyrhizobium diazoefficiens TaxID=1355477 RepID=UPI00057739AE
MPPRIHKIPAEPAAPLPDRFEAWFAARGWSPRAHQLALLEKAREDRSALLIAPTGAGKTLAGFLPTLVELSSFSSPSPLVGEGRGGGWPQAPLVALPPSRQPAAADLPHKGGGDNNSLVSTGRSVQRSAGLHTLYISPLKALAVDIARNLERPIAEMALPIKVETRTGDTPVSRRA